MLYKFQKRKYNRRSLAGLCKPKPSHDIAHDEFLTNKQCLDADPLKRPKVKDLSALFINFYNDVYILKDWR
jgi:hypothetical protein